MNAALLLNRWKILLVGLGFSALLILAGCGPAGNPIVAGEESVNQSEKVLQLPAAVADEVNAADEELAEDLSITLPSQTLVDSQGAVEVAVTPQPEATIQSGRLVFEVAMNTHSVDLSMDLAEAAELVTDSGLTLPASTWSGGSGHHVTGYLEFELPIGSGAGQLAQAKNWVLTIRGVDAAQRVFIWDIG